MGTVSGTFKAYPEACLIWIDAHAVRPFFPPCQKRNRPSNSNLGRQNAILQDINTPLTSPSGNLHGCPVSFLLGLEGAAKGDVPEFDWIDAVLKPERLVYIGLRDIDEGERKILKDNSAFILLPHPWVGASSDIR